MRKSHPWLTWTALTLGITGVGLGALAVADDIGKPGTPVPQKTISNPFLDTLLGSWTTESTSIHEGKESKGTGRSTYAKGIGDTAILQTYESTGTGPDGKTVNYHGHGVYKLSDDGKSATAWWFCNMSPDVMKITGSVKDTGLELSGIGPDGNRAELSFQKSPDGGLAFKMTSGENEMKENYKRAK